MGPYRFSGGKGLNFTSYVLILATFVLTSIKVDATPASIIVSGEVHYFGRVSEPSIFPFVDGERITLKLNYDPFDAQRVPLNHLAGGGEENARFYFLDQSAARNFQLIAEDGRTVVGELNDFQIRNGSVSGVDDILFFNTADPGLFGFPDAYLPNFNGSYNHINGALQGRSFSQGLFNLAELPSSPNEIEPSNFAGGYAEIFGVREGQFVGKTLLFNPDSNSLSFVAHEPPMEVEPPDATVYLDFDSGVGIGLDVITDGDGTVRTIPVVGETHPSSNLVPALRENIATALGDIFERSGVAVEITTQRPSQGDYYTVEFGASIPGSRLGGIAYDALPVTNEVLHWLVKFDRFDKRKDGKVAVFETAALPDDDADLVAAIAAVKDDADFIAEIAAHELGHAFGLRHIEADFPIDVVPGSNEVMDYSYDGPGAEFNDKFQNVYEFDPGEFLDITHNPQYHLRRFLGGEAKNALIEEGLNPGTWDELLWTVYGYEFGPGTILDPIDAWYLVSSEDAGYYFRSEEPRHNLIDVTSILASKTNIKFEVPDWSKFSIFGRSKGSDVIDLFIGKGNDAINENFSLFETGDINLEDQFTLFQTSLFSDQITNLGEIELMRTSVRQIAATPIPLPPSGAFMLVGLLLVSAAKNRKFFSI